jgi:Tfp pilus assembly protein PilE
MLIIDCNKDKNGFTVVELIVVIVTIGIITATTTFAYTNIQKQSRDSQRSADAAVIAEGLERYYATNGEYPSVAKMTPADATSVKQLLKLNNLDSLVAPNATPGATTNAWKAGSATTTNKLTYTGNTDTSSSCLTGSATGDVCDDYKIQYYKEDTDTVETIYSRSKAPATPPAPTAPIIAAPTPPVLTTALNGGSVTATRTDTSCQAGAITLYSFRSRQNDGTWGGYSAWATAPSTSSTVSQGVKYGFQVKAKCLEGDYSSVDAVGVEATYIHPISTPAAPVLTVTPAADNDSATWNWAATACPAGTTAQYVTQFYRDDATGWRAYNFAAPQTTTSVTYATNYEGYDHRARVEARCISSFDTSDWSADSNSPSFASPVTAPGDAFNFRWSSYNGKPTFTWSETSCGLGAQLQRRWWGYHEATQYFADGSSTTSGGTTDIFNSTRAGADTFAQWKNTAPVTPSQLDMTIVNQMNFISTSAVAPGWEILVGSPNTNSVDDDAVKAVVQLRCINTTTNRNAQGNYFMSPMLYR